MPNQPSRKPARIFKLILINLFIFAAVFAALEIYMRRTQPYIVMDVVKLNQALEKAGESRRFFVAYTMDGRRLVPDTRSMVKNHPLSHQDVEIRINSQGFRGPEIPEPKPAGQFRVLVMGDSITLAPYLPEDKTYVAVMQDRLRELTASRDVLVINGGVVDVGIKEEVDILAEQGLAVKPDLVVVGFYLNDLRPPLGFPGEKQAPGFIRRYSVLAQFIYQRLELKKFIADKGLGRFDAKDQLKKDDWKKDRDAFMRLVNFTHFDWGAAWKDGEWEIVDRELARLKDYAAQNNFRVIIAAFPVSFQVYADFIEDKPQRIMQAKAAQYGFQYIDLLPVFRQNSGRELFYDHCHLNPLGNQIAGREIADKINEAMKK